MHGFQITEDIEQYRDRKWRREDELRVERVEEVEAMVEDLGFCLGMTDSRKKMPSVYTAVCGRRDAHMPRNVQKDPEASLAWVLKDETVARGRVYYGKVWKGHSMFLAKRMIPAFNVIWGCTKSEEASLLSENARRVLKVLRKEWEMATADLRDATGLDRTSLTKAVDELQKRMKVIPQEVLYVPKFTYIWTLAEARFPAEMKVKLKYEDAVREIARAYLSLAGLTLRGELSSRFGFRRPVSGQANAELVNEGFAERLDTGIYRLVTNQFPN
ncbi:MAG: hypothetical protein QUS14_04235 [Pyrinomonadaceae bacterium]|nr:hypothetical protein [Pyrinomonadaceae bacterium]